MWSGWCTMIVNKDLVSDRLIVYDIRTSFLLVNWAFKIRNKLRSKPTTEDSGVESMNPFDATTHGSTTLAYNNKWKWNA